jgi:hypothetical protein
VPQGPLLPQGGGGNASLGGKASPKGEGEWVHPIDPFGCFVFQPGFNFEGYAPEQWQQWWGVSHHCIAAASAHYSSVREETLQRDEGDCKAKGKGKAKGQGKGKAKDKGKGKDTGKGKPAASPRPSPKASPTPTPKQSPRGDKGGHWKCLTPKCYTVVPN